LEINITIDDPKAYAKTWSGYRNFKLRPTWNIKEFICADNSDYNEEFINKSGAYNSSSPSKQHANQRSQQIVSSKVLCERPWISICASRESSLLQASWRVRAVSDLR